ncbi:hypothetical protein DER46DRAFT_64905 [Fusarium sp. MPI-SDFR-AT-0072]|nr:hypothetical protein DER46DRAFT_64905 [Fusarium sp. MPI-SDFR-AT-0072]
MTVQDSLSTLLTVLVVSLKLIENILSLLADYRHYLSFIKLSFQSIDQLSLKPGVHNLCPHHKLGCPCLGRIQKPRLKSRSQPLWLKTYLGNKGLWGLLSCTFRGSRCLAAISAPGSQPTRRNCAAAQRPPKLNTSLFPQGSHFRLSSFPAP